MKQLVHVICPFESEKRRVIFEHIRSLHVNTADICKCDLCPFETMYKCNLVNHVKKMHNNLGSSLEANATTANETKLSRKQHGVQPEQEDNQPSSSPSYDNPICDVI